jgi:hypothetical protein
MMAENIHVRADINPDAIQVENNDNDDGNQDPPNPPQNVIFPPAVPGAAQMTLAFKVEKSKIPEFFVQKGKDNISAIVFIRKIDDLAGTN